MRVTRGIDKPRPLFFSSFFQLIRGILLCLGAHDMRLPDGQKLLMTVDVSKYNHSSSFMKDLQYLVENLLLVAVVIDDHEYASLSFLPPCLSFLHNASVPAAVSKFLFNAEPLERVRRVLGSGKERVRRALASKNLPRGPFLQPQVLLFPRSRLLPSLFLHRMLEVEPVPAG